MVASGVCHTDAYTLSGAVVVEHCLAVQHLPWVHRDPFDRLLVAAARETGFQLITADRTLLAYGPEVMASCDV